MTVRYKRKFYEVIEVKPERVTKNDSIELGVVQLGYVDILAIDSEHKLTELFDDVDSFEFYI